MENTPNSNEENKEVVEKTNPQLNQEGTEQKETEQIPVQEIEPVIDYQKKFSESSKEALKIREENKILKEQLELKDNQDTPTEGLYPGFEELNEEEQKNLLEYTNRITNRAKEEIYKDPAIAFAKSSYNEKVWNDAFTKVLEKYPELNESKDEFKSKYYDVNNVPVNIDSILEDVAKVHLFDKAKSIGAEEEKQKLNRSETERANSGAKKSKSVRTLDDWSRMAKENPMKFAKLSKEYKSDLDSGKI